MAVHRLTEKEQSQIETIREFQEAVASWGRSQLRTDRVQLRRLINQLSRTVREIVRTAGCSKKLDISPPPRIAGYTIRGVDPFDHIFEAPYDMDLRQHVIDMCDQAVGVIQAGDLDINEEHKEKTGRSSNNLSTSKVFVVHGHDEAARESVARFLEKLNLEAIILHEQPNAGNTIIEKFEEYSDVAFAVVLLTPDDVGAKRGNEGHLEPRARQNVVFELGFFHGKLGRSNVASLLKDSIEKPSDYDGIGYIPMDTGGGWKLELVKEMKSAGLAVEMDNIV